MAISGSRRMTMPKFQYFDENKKLIEERQELLDNDNINRYLEKNGVERTLGYIEAILDITQKTDTILTRRYSDISSVGQTPAYIRRELTLFHEQQLKFLKSEAVQRFLKMIDEAPK